MRRLLPQLLRCGKDEKYRGWTIRGASDCATIDPNGAFVSRCSAVQTLRLAIALNCHIFFALEGVRS
jgi:hypothetical protein